MLPKQEYENCSYINCNFSGSDLSNVTFRECLFTDCDLSLAQMKNTVFSDVQFLNCKLLGLHFDNCDDLFLSVDFENCILELSVFYKILLKRTRFKDCNLSGADFTETNLSHSLFLNCNLKNTIFERSILEHVDFTSSFNFSINPEANKISKAKFSKENLIGLLDKYQIVLKP